MLQTKFGDHSSISSIEVDVRSFFQFLALETLKGVNQINMNTLGLRLPKNATDKVQTKFGDHPSISSIEIDV
jgi:hypothetical protein